MNDQYAGRSSFGGNSMDRDTGYNNKRYNHDFLLSLKDKKLSKTFPDALANFELAVMDQNVGFVFLRGLREKQIAAKSRL
jgi:hypothetical protein